MGAGFLKPVGVLDLVGALARLIFSLFGLLGGQSWIISIGHVQIAATGKVECESGDAFRYISVSWNIKIGV